MKWISIVVVSLILVISSVLLVFNTRNNYKFVEVGQDTRQSYINYLNKQVNNNVYNNSRQDIREMLEEELEFRNYTYKEGNVKNGGYSVAFYKYIKMDSVIDIEQYCIVLCHEMCHIKYFTANEIYTQFMAFKTLYESDNSILKSMGTWFGIYVLNRNYENNYDCSKLIVDYLKEKV